MKKIVILFIIPFVVIANELPLWEFGMAGGYADVPHYPSANQSKERFLFIPVFFYRGKIFRSDQNDGLRARLSTNEKFQLDLSYGGSFPANSEGNDARKGMEDLDWTFEVGPRFSYNFIENDKIRTRLLAAIRPAVTTDFSHTQLRGYRSVISFNHQNNEFIKKNWNSSFSISTTFLTEELSDYFFEVTKKDVSPGRQLYNAKGGYFSIGVSGTLILNYDKKNFVAGLSYVNYNDSVIEDSPLYRNKSNTVLFIAMNWFFYESEKKGFN